MILQQIQIVYLGCYRLKIQTFPSVFPTREPKHPKLKNKRPNILFDFIYHLKTFLQVSQIQIHVQIGVLNNTWEVSFTKKEDKFKHIPFDFYFAGKKGAVFDIETTGLSPKNSALILSK